MRRFLLRDREAPSRHETGTRFTRFQAMRDTSRDFFQEDLASGELCKDIYQNLLVVKGQSFYRFDEFLKT
jgi:hypothetical protein